MNLSESQLNEITELSMLQFTPEEVAKVLGLNVNEFIAEINDDSSKIAFAYECGRLKAEAEIRKSIFSMAKQGSTPAQKQMMDLINQNKRHQKKRMQKTT